MYSLFVRLWRFSRIYGFVVKSTVRLVLVGRAYSHRIPLARLKCLSEKRWLELCNALDACTELNAVYRRLLKMALEELRLIDEQIGQLDQEMASLLSEHQDAVQRLAEVPGLGVDSAAADHCRSRPYRSDLPPRNVSPRGWAPAPATTKAQA